MTDWRLGTMGFSYAEWAGAFYPKGMKSGDYLPFYAGHFNAVELDTTFHAAPSRERVERWAEAVPEGFRFCVKMPRTITHESPPDRAVGLAMDFADTVRAFGPKLAAVLLQFPPSFTSAESKRLAALLAALPADLRFAVEFRHRSWWSDHTAALLQRHRACWALGDYANEPAQIRPTTDFLYLRFIGVHQQFSQLDHEQQDVIDRLLWWQRQLEKALRGHPHVRGVYAFFNNDYAGYAVGTADRFKRLLGLPVPPLPGLRGQGELFPR